MFLKFQYSPWLTYFIFLSKAFNRSIKETASQFSTSLYLPPGRKKLASIALGEGQTLKPSQTPSSFGVSASPQGQNLADAKVSNAHPEFVASTQKLIDAAKIGALTRAAAIHEAEHLIGNYSRTREQDALNWLQKRTNQPSLLVLPPEMQLQLETQRKLYLEQFVKIMNEAINAQAK